MTDCNIYYSYQQRVVGLKRDRVRSNIYTKSRRVSPASGRSLFPIIFSRGKTNFNYKYHHCIVYNELMFNEKVPVAWHRLADRRRRRQTVLLIFFLSSTEMYECAIQ